MFLYTYRIRNTHGARPAREKRRELILQWGSARAGTDEEQKSEEIEPVCVRVLLPRYRRMHRGAAGDTNHPRNTATV